MDRHLAYDPPLLVALKHATDAAIWHIAATRFDHAYCEEWRAAVLAIRPRLEELRDTLLQPVIDSDAMSASIAATLPALIVVDGEVLDTPDEIRAYFEAGADAEHVEQYGTVVAAMLGLTPADAAAYWNTLSDEERERLIDTRPDLAARALEGGAELSAAELDLLDLANAYPQFSDTFAVTFGLEVGRVLTINLEHGWSVVAMKMSDDTVQVAVVRTDGLGGGVARGDEDGGAAANLGVFAAATTVFVFPDEETAEEAILDLRGAVDGYDVGDALLNAGLFVLSLATHQPPPAFLIPDDEISELVDELWDNFGMSRREEGGLYGEIAAGVTNELGEAGIEGEIRISVYDTEPVTGADRSGLLLSGTLSGHAEVASPVGGSMSAAGSFSVDVYTENDVEFVTVTVTGSASTGAVANMVDFAGVDVDLQAEAGGQVTVSVKVPLDGDTIGNITGLVTSVTNGELPAVVGEAYDDADITVTVDTTFATSTEGEVGAGIVEASEQRTVSSSQNLVTLHKYPDGEFYSQNDLNSDVDIATATVDFAPQTPTPYSPDAFLYHENGEPGAIVNGDSYEQFPNDSPPASSPTGQGQSASSLPAILQPEPGPVEPDPNAAVMSDPDAEPTLLYDLNGVPVATIVGREIVPLPEDWDGPG